MPSPWLESKTPVGPPASADPSLRQLLYAGVVTGAWSAVACLLLYLAGCLFRVDFIVAPAGGGDPSPLPWPAFIAVPLIAAVAFSLLASLARGWRSAGRIVFWVGTLAALASLAGPLLQPAAVPWPTRILLAVMHAVTWALVVPQVARIVGDSEPGRSVERDDQP